MLFNQTIKNINRIREVIQILLKYGFEDIVSSTPLHKLVPSNMRLKWSRQDRPRLEFSRYERLRLAAEDLGPSFVKLAQVLSNRPDILPEALIVELEKLQNDVPPFKFSKAKKIIEGETGQLLEELFSDFDETPIGSASIGQVYKAQLHTGEDVVIKVQRPGVKEVVETDLVILKELAKLTDNYFKKQGITNTMDIVDTFEKVMRKELNYFNESRNLEQFRTVYENYPNLYIPRVYKSLTTEKILILEYIDGCKITDVRQQRAWGIDPRDTAEKGMDIYLTQFFEYGFFHADPHPGNVLVRKDGVICLIDFGIVGRLMKRDKYAFSGILLSMAQQDPKSMAINLKRLAMEDDIADMKAFEYDLNELIEEFASLDVAEMNIADFSRELQKIIYNYHLKIPSSAFLILRALVILEGIGKVIHPGFKTFEFVKPYGKKILKEQFSFENIGLEFYYSFLNIYTFFNTFPVEINYLLQKLKKGQLKIQIEHQGHKQLLQTINFTAFRIMMALIISALLIASAIVSTAPLEKNLSTPGGIPYISLVGFSIAAFLGFILLIASLRGPKNN